MAVFLSTEATSLWYWA